MKQKKTKVFILGNCKTGNVFRSPTSCHNHVSFCLNNSEKRL